MPALDPPLEATPAWSLTWRVTSKFKFTPLSWGLAPVVTPTLTRSLIARVALTRAPPLALELMSRLSTPSDFRTFSKASTWPDSVATAFANSSAWNADKLPDDFWNRTRERISSSGRLGLELI